MGEGAGEPTLSERAAQNSEAQRALIRETPLVRAALETFPDAELLDIDPQEKWSASA